MNVSQVRGVMSMALPAVVIAGVVAYAIGSTGQDRVSKPAYTPAGRLAVVEVRAEGPRGQMPEVVVRADGPEYRLETIEVVAAAAGPARGLLPVVEVRARRSLPETGELAHADTSLMDLN